MNQSEYILKFNGTINPSIQKGDIVWSSGNIQAVGDTSDFSHEVTDNDNGQSSMSEIGIVTDIKNLGSSYEITIEADESFNPSTTAFYFFSKNNIANKSSIKGYYNKVKFTNDSKVKAELFATSFAVSQSSK